MKLHIFHLSAPLSDGGEEEGAERFFNFSEYLYRKDLGQVEILGGN